LGSVVVSAAPLSVAVSGSQTYGGSATYTGDQPSFVTGSLACSTTATAASPVGDYPITECSGLSVPNYTVGYELGSVHVAPATLHVQPDGGQPYGGTAGYGATA